MFAPGILFITNISNANGAIVTTSTNHNLVTGEAIRLLVPQATGFGALNNKIFVVGAVSPASPTKFRLTLSQVPPQIFVNTILFPTYNSSIGNPAIPAQVIPIGSSPSQFFVNNIPFNFDECVTKLNDQLRNYSTSNIPF